MADRQLDIVADFAEDVIASICSGIASARYFDNDRVDAGR
jgi:hypothetical protein